MLWVNLIMGLFIVAYFAFSAVTVYMFMVGKLPPGEPSVLAKLIRWHGAGIIWVLVVTSIITLAMIFAFVILHGLGLFATPADIISITGRG